MILQETFTLSNGVKAPKVGLGTWFIKNEHAAQAVKDAARIGYRHLDTAQAYGNEAGVGDGVRSCGVKRDDIFVTSKLGAEIKTYKDAVSAIDQSLQTMGLDVIDLMLIHSPQPWANFGDEDRCFEGNREAWRALEAAHKAGKLRAIGVSNFERPDLDNILQSCAVKPMVNQVLAHISNTPFELIRYNQEQGVLVEAYSPVAHGELLKNAELIAMAKTYGVSVPQLCIRYVLQLDLLALPKTGNPAHMKANADVDFVISETDMERLKSMRRIEDYGDASIFPVYGGRRD